MHRRLPDELHNDKNKEVLKFIEPLSCHSDIVEPLSQCLRQYDDVSCFTPDSEAFKYVLWYVKDTVFAFAVGMHGVSLRISSECTFSGREHEHLKGWTSLPFDSSELCDAARMAYKSATSS